MSHRAPSCGARFRLRRWSFCKSFVNRRWLKPHPRNVCAQGVRGAARDRDARGSYRPWLEPWGNLPRDSHGRGREGWATPRNRTDVESAHPTETTCGCGMPGPPRRRCRLRLPPTRRILSRRRCRARNEQLVTSDRVWVGFSPSWVGFSPSRTASGSGPSSLI